MTSPTETAPENNDTPIRLLALGALLVPVAFDISLHRMAYVVTDGVKDGGGIRGLSELIILKYLMQKVDQNNPPKPCDYFHLIGGTSTGG